MCGLVGMAGRFNTLDKKSFKTMLFIDQLRGEHSTGVATLSQQSEIVVYKRALPAADFLQLNKAKSVIDSGYGMLIGHNRYATMGAKDDNNAHPFHHGNIVLAHNGTLDTKSAVNKDMEIFSTDSETIAYALNEDGAVVKDVLERLEGAYALSWYDASDDTINFARNSERPLWFAIMNGCLAWSSLKSTLYTAAEHAKAQITNVWELPVGSHHKWDLTKLGEPVTEEFTPAKKKPTYLGGNRSWGSGTGATSSHKRTASRIQAWISEIRENGYCRGITQSGDHVTCTVPKAMVPVVKDAFENGDQISGSIASSTALGKGKVSYNLSSLGLTLVPWSSTSNKGGTDSKKKCAFCLTTIEDSEKAEMHRNEYYHSDCLDDWETYVKETNAGEE